MAKREPVAELGDEDYKIVRHTHDVELAERLMRDRLIGEGYYHPDETFTVGTPRQTHVRIIPAAPGNIADSYGWDFEYRECPPGRGAFRAVVFT